MREAIGQRAVEDDHLLVVLLVLRSAGHVPWARHHGVVQQAPFRMRPFRWMACVIQSLLRVIRVSNEDTPKNQGTRAVLIGGCVLDCFARVRRKIQTVAVNSAAEPQQPITNLMAQLLIVKAKTSNSFVGAKL